MNCDCGILRHPLHVAGGAFFFHEVVVDFGICLKGNL